jgi:peptidoglycan/LPS O-acetylase OafA/YrhL
MEKERFKVLDGWRGLSILLVLAAHLLPLGPKAWDLNVATGLLGMVFFFILSGFLVTHFLLSRYGVAEFLIRRFFRILPLVWLYLTLVFLVTPVSIQVALSNYLFYGNYPPGKFISTTPHMWSLCVEVHFYIGVALLVGALGKRGLSLIPLLLLFFSLLRVIDGAHYSIVTHLRIDEILAGATLALIYNGKFGRGLRNVLARLSLPVVLILLLVSCHPDSGFMGYLRPYFAAMVVGATLFRPTRTPGIRLLQHKVLFYIATISFALYVIHPFLMQTWLGSGETLERYAKRPLLLAVLFVLAHLSTFYYEQKWIAMGKALSNRLLKIRTKDVYGTKEETK